MPSGKVHTAITLGTAPIIGIGAYQLTKDLRFSSYLASAYAFSGLMFSGDLDIKSSQSARWSLLSFIWIPYRSIFKHRSYFTHSSVVGTFVRLIYLFLCGIVISGLLYIAKIIHNIGFDNLSFITFFKAFKAENYATSYVNFVINFIKNNKIIVRIIIFGLILGAFSHNFTDNVWTSIKRTYNKFKRKKKRRK